MAYLIFTLSPWDYRDVLGYLVRDQTDYSDVFQLRKFRGSAAGLGSLSSAWLTFSDSMLRCR